MEDEHAARRLPAGVDGLLAERAGRVEAVDDEQGHEHAERERGRQMLPFWARLGAARCRSARDAGWTWAKNSRISANTTIPRISVATPMLLRIDSSRTP